MKKNHKSYDRSIEDIPHAMEMNAVTAECLARNKEGKEERISVRIELADGRSMHHPYTGTYMEFVQKFTDDIRALGYTDDDLEYHKVESGTEVLDIRAHIRGKDVIYRVYPPVLYVKALNEDYESVVKDILDQIRNTEDDMEEMDFSSTRLNGSYEELRKNLIIRPLNFITYASKLRNGICHRHGDVALVLYLLLGDLNGQLMTRMIEKRELDEWNMADQCDEIFNEALKQTAQRYPAMVLSEKSDEMIDLMHGEYQREDIVSSDETMQLSSSIGVNGATALFYPGVSRKIAQIMQGNYAAVFMNTSDVMILKPDNPDLNTYMQFASHENVRGEMLSGRKYLFDQEGQLINA